jgi:hypothetical protein
VALRPEIGGGYGSGRLQEKDTILRILRRIEALEKEVAELRKEPAKQKHDFDPKYERL